MFWIKCHASNSATGTTPVVVLQHLIWNSYYGNIGRINTHFIDTLTLYTCKIFYLFLSQYLLEDLETFLGSTKALGEKFNSK